MRPALVPVSNRQGGVFTRMQAIAAGCCDAEIRALTRPGGPWVPVRRGAYVERQQWATWSEDVRYAARVRAALLQASPLARASHQSAAALHRMPLRPRWRSELHATRPNVQGTRRQAGLSVHPASIPPADDAIVQGFRATGLARTAVDIAREHGHEDGVIACDVALRLGVARADLERVVRRMWSWPGVVAARAAIEDADGGAAGIGESLTRLLVCELGIGRPETQFEISDGSRVAFADLRIGPHLIEFDGKVKYLRREAGGVSDVPPDVVLWREKRREDWLRSLGYGVSRVVWSELFGPERRRTQQRILGEYQATLRWRGGHIRGA